MNLPDPDKKFQSIVVLTGAGISAESGIQTFRASDGLWHDHRIEDVASPEGFRRNPSLVHDFYNARRRGLLSEEVQPNAGHKALSKLEQKFDGNFFLVTQNVDDLHSRSGNKNYCHMHGELLKARCSHCQAVQSQQEDLNTDTVCNNCSQSGGMRPDIVWFGEQPMFMDTIIDQLENCDLFLSIGTSGNVYPAAGFVQLANDSGAETWEINLEPANNTSNFHYQVYGKATETVPAFVEQILKSNST